MSTTSGRIAFDAREERVVAGLARWMGLLGRFQIVGATFLFVLLLAAAALATTAELLEPATRAATEDPPLVSLGEVSRTAIAIVVAVVVGFSLLFFRGGILLIGASEDLEAVVDKDEHDPRLHLDGAIRRLRDYFVLEAILIAVGLGGLYALTLWGAA